MPCLQLKRTVRVYKPVEVVERKPLDMRPSRAASEARGETKKPVLKGAVIGDGDVTPATRTEHAVCFPDEAFGLSYVLQNETQDDRVDRSVFRGQGIELSKAEGVAAGLHAHLRVRFKHVESNEARWKPVVDKRACTASDVENNLVFREIRVQEFFQIRMIDFALGRKGQAWVEGRSVGGVFRVMGRMAHALLAPFELWRMSRFFRTDRKGRRRSVLAIVAWNSQHPCDLVVAEAHQ